MMKIALTLITIMSTSLYANKNWIEIEPIINAEAPKENTKHDINLSKIEPINKIMKNATLIKQLIEATSKKEKQSINDKNWFEIKNEDYK